jgi:outer membrane scaffolding protein for murein synthesis (MipA/OmpV family)
LAAAAFLAAAGPALAGEMEPLWELGLGGSVLDLPHYRGSDQRHTWVLPVPFFVYRGDILRADREGARAVLFESSRWNFDLSLGAGAPTRSSDDVARQGMADLPATLELGPNLNYTLARDATWKLDLRAPLRAAFTIESHPRSIGFISTPNLNLDMEPVRHWHVSVLGSLVYADRRYNAHFYDVRPEEARPDRPAYAAGGGYGGTQLIAATSRRFPHFWAGAFVKFDSLNGAVFTDSPLVRQRQQWSAGFALLWVAAASKTMVETPP